MSQKLSGFITTYTNVTNWDTQLHLSPVQLEQKKSTEWGKVELDASAKIVELFGKSSSVQYANEQHMHSSAMFHILSEKLFRSEDDKSYYVYQIGSIHNMHGVVSTMKTLPLAISNGTSQFHLALDMIQPLSLHEFYQKVVKNNASRSSFMLSPKYYFNPQLNLLRKLPGKTIDFVTGKLEDDGIIVDDEIEFDEEEETDEEEEGEETDQDGDSNGGSGDDDDDGLEEAKSEAQSEGKNSSKTVTTFTTTSTTMTTALSASTSSGGKVSKKKRTPLATSTSTEKVVLESTGSGW